MQASRYRRVLTEVQKRKLAWEQKYLCAICTQLLPAQWEADHIVALSNGGGNGISNFQILCPNCHAAKTQAERMAAVNAKVQKRLAAHLKERELDDIIEDKITTQLADQAFHRVVRNGDVGNLAKSASRETVETHELSHSEDDVDYEKLQFKIDSLEKFRFWGGKSIARDKLV